MNSQKNKTKKALRSAADLIAAVRSERAALHNFYFGSTGGKITNVKAARTSRRQIARCLTELRHATG